MIHNHISSVGSLADAMLRKKSGTVMAVFNSTVYLSAGQQLFCLVAAHLARGPLHVNTPVPDFGHVRTGTAWCMRGNFFCIDDYLQLSIAEASTWSPSLPATPLNPQQLRITLRLLDPMLKATRSENNAGTVHAVHKRLCAGQRALQHWLHTPGHPLPEAVLRLIGCGNGLTPDGDDLLLGALLALKYLQLDDEAATLAHESRQYMPGNTNDISQAHLLAACKGFASEPVHDFLCTLHTPAVTAQHIVRQAQAVIATGHTSGLYTLQGIATVLRAHLNSTCPQKSKCNTAM